MKLFNKTVSTRNFDINYGSYNIKGSATVVNDNRAQCVFRVLNNKKIVMNFSTVYIDKNIYEIEHNDVVNQIINDLPEEFL